MLRKAGVDHYIDIASTGIASHKSSDGKRNYKDRIEKYAAWGGAIFEAILYGPKKPHARDVVLALVIDDGFEARTHRKNLFYSEHGEVALVAGDHSTADFCYVALFAS